MAVDAAGGPSKVCGGGPEIHGSELLHQSVREHYVGMLRYSEFVFMDDVEC